MRTNRWRMTAVAAAGALGLICAGCGSPSLEGHTYRDSTGTVAVKFASGDKASLATGPIMQSCRYSKSDHAVTLDCSGGQFNFAIGDDGALTGSPSGIVARLTKTQ
jgi:hypothetical protein